MEVMHGQPVTNEYLLRIVVLLKQHLVRVGGVMTFKCGWMKENWELWTVPIALMVVLIFIGSLHSYQHQYGNAHGQQNVCEKEY